MNNSKADEANKGVITLNAKVTSLQARTVGLEEKVDKQSYSQTRFNFGMKQAY